MFLSANAAAVQAVFSPSKIDGGQVLEYENGLAAANQQMLSNFNTTLLALQPASQAGALKQWHCNQGVQRSKQEWRALVRVWAFDVWPIGLALRSTGCLLT